jgi:uncharacterized protein (DUF58 family)
MRSVLSESWLLVSGGIVLVGALADSAVLLAMGVLLFGTGAVSRIWSRLSLEGVGYTRTLEERRAFVGERIGLKSRLTNDKILPVPWVEVRDHLPRDLPVTGARTRASGMPRVVFIERSTSIGAHETLDWDLELQPWLRGYYRLGPARLRSGDLFGLFEVTRNPTEHDVLLVYPQTLPLADLGFESTRPFGELRGGSRLFEDPSRVVGLREYLPGDPLRRIDWNATARSGQLQSRLYEPSRTSATVVALNITTMERSWEGYVPLLLERGVSVAASVARDAAERGEAVGLVANGAFPDSDRPIRIGASNAPDQLLRVLEALATIAPFTTVSLASELESRTHTLPVGATVVVVAALMPPDLLATLQRLRSEGHSVHVVRTSDASWDSLGSIPVHDVADQMRANEESQGLDRLLAPDRLRP